MGMHKKTISAKEFNGPKKLPSGSDGSGKQSRGLKAKKKAKRK